MATQKQPYAVYTVRPRKGQDKPFWVRIGTGFLHKSGKGINVVLDSLPLDGKLVIVPQQKKDEEKGDGDGPA
jgi:hypothetical protein